MVNWLKYSRSCYAKLWCFLVFVLLTACESQQEEWYKKEVDPSRYSKLAETFTNGIQFYYQGSPGSQLLLMEALAYNPNYALAEREMGVPYLKRGIATGFYRHYAKAADLDPTGWIGWRGYLYLYFYRDYRRAISDFDRLDVLTPDIVDYPQSTSVDFMRGICYLMLENYEVAIYYFDKHIAHETKVTSFKYVPSESFLYRGIAQWRKGDTALAKASFETGHELDPDNADLLYQLASWYAEAGQARQARRYLAQAQSAFDKGYYNTRPYVEEFFQLYQEDLDKRGESL